MKQFTNYKPTSFEDNGDGSFYYRWNIEEITGTETAYQFNYVMVWAPLTVDRVTDAVVHSKYSIKEETDILNDYRNYQSGINPQADAVEKYLEYITFVASTITQVKSDFEVNDNVVSITQNVLLQESVKALSLVVNTIQLSDSDSLSIKTVYPRWENYIGKLVTAGMKLQYNGKLWKVLQNHTVQELYKPGPGTESLYTEVVESTEDKEMGTLDNPIPYDNNMKLEIGKYYSQNEVVYKCTRDTGQPVYNPLVDLVGIYVEVVR